MLKTKMAVIKTGIKRERYCEGKVDASSSFH